MPHRKLLKPINEEIDYQELNDRQDWRTLLESIEKNGDAINILFDKIIDLQKQIEELKKKE